MPSHETSPVDSVRWDVAVVYDPQTMYVTLASDPEAEHAARTTKLPLVGAFRVVADTPLPFKITRATSPAVTGGKVNAVVGGAVVGFVGTTAGDVITVAFAAPMPVTRSCGAVDVLVQAESASKLTTASAAGCKRVMSGTIPLCAASQPRLCGE